MHPRTTEQKTDVQVDHKSHYFCCITTKTFQWDVRTLTFQWDVWSFSELLLRPTQVNCLLSDKDKQQYKDHLCLFRVLTMDLHGHSNLDAHTSQLFTEFISNPGYDLKNFRGVSIDDLPLVDEIVERNIFIYNFDIQEIENV